MGLQTPLSMQHCAQYLGTPPWFEMAEPSAYSKERGLEERKEPHLVLFDKSSWKKPERCMELGAGWLP